MANILMIHMFQEIYLLQKAYRKICLTIQKHQALSAEKELIRIIPYPGMSYPILASDTKAVLHESYHSGTIAVNDEFISFAESALEKNIPVYLTGLSDTEAVYASVEKYLKYGITALPECSSISQYCKLWLSICNNLDILSVMQKSYADEFVNL